MILRAFSALNGKIYFIFKYLTILLLVAMSILIFAQVVFRYLLGHPLSWSEEFSIYLFTWCSFFGAAMIARNNLHIRVTAFLDFIKNGAARKIVEYFSDLLLLVFCLSICIVSATLVARMIKIDQRSPSMEWLSTGYIFICVPISMLTIAFFKIESLVVSLCGKKQKEGNTK